MIPFQQYNTGDVLEAWQGISSALWRVKREAIMKEGHQQQRKRRDISFLSSGVGGNAKTGIKFYGKGSPSLEVRFNAGLQL